MTGPFGCAELKLETGNLKLEKTYNLLLTTYNKPIKQRIRAYLQGIGERVRLKERN
jgi:hypothetical protein